MKHGPAGYPDRMASQPTYTTEDTKITDDENYRMVLAIARWARRVTADPEDVRDKCEMLGLDVHAAKRMVRGYSEGP
jgi:hypothetical protein